MRAVRAAKRVEEDKASTIRLKLVLIGPWRAGKTSIIRTYCLGDRGFSPDYLETIGVDYGVKAVDFGGKYTVRLAFWDMAGLPEYAGIRRELYDDCSGVFLVYDVTDNASFKRLNWWIEELENHGRCRIADDRSGEKPVVIVVGNKVDEEDKRKVTEAEGRAFAARYGLPHVETSAATGEGIEELFAMMLARTLAARKDSPQELLELAEKAYEDV